MSHYLGLQCFFKALNIFSETDYISRGEIQFSIGYFTQDTVVGAQYFIQDAVVAIITSPKMPLSSTLQPRCHCRGQTFTQDAVDEVKIPLLHN